MKSKSGSVLSWEKWLPDESNEVSIHFHWCHTAERQAEKAGKIGEQIIRVRSQDPQSSLKLHHSHMVEFGIFSNPVMVQLQLLNEIMKVIVITVPTMCLWCWGCCPTTPTLVYPKLCLSWEHIYNYVFITTRQLYHLLRTLMWVAAWNS